MDDESATLLINAFAAYRKLSKLTLRFINKKRKWLGDASRRALGDLLENTKTKLEELDLGGNDIDDGASAALANGLATNTTVKKLSINANGITATGWGTLSRSLTKPNSQLELLNVGRNHIDGDGLIALVRVVASNPMLKDLDIGNVNVSISAAEWRSFFNMLQSSDSALEKLRLDGNNISDEVVPTMVDALASIRFLKTLSLERNRFITALGWGAISDLLNRPNSRLHTLCLNGNNINNEVVISFANSLVNNTSLKELQFCDEDVISSSWASRGWAALSN